MSNGDAKEWVTVKLPKDVRDAARDDSRTYGEIMRAGLDVDDIADIRAAAAEGIDTERFAKNLQANIEFPDDLREQLDRIESAAKEATNAAQSAENAVEGLQP